MSPEASAPPSPLPLVLDHPNENSVISEANSPTDAATPSSSTSSSPPSISSAALPTRKREREEDQVEEEENKDSSAPTSPEEDERVDKPVRAHKRARIEHDESVTTSTASSAVSRLDVPLSPDGSSPAAPPTNLAVDSVADLDSLPVPVPRPVRVMVFGENDEGELGLGVGKAPLGLYRPTEQSILSERLGGSVTGIAGGAQHSIAADSTGQVWTWGSNEAGALGRKTLVKVTFDLDNEDLKRELEEEYEENLQRKLEHEPRSVQIGFKVAQVAAGELHSCAVGMNGKFAFWGTVRDNTNKCHRIGPSSADSSPIQLLPITFPVLADHFVSQVVSGANHVLVLTAEGLVFAVGLNAEKQLGVCPSDTLLPEPALLPLKDIVYIAAGGSTSFAVDKDGEVHGWGRSVCLGLTEAELKASTPSSEDFECVSTPTRIPTLSPSKHDGARVVQIAIGTGHAVFLFSTGSVWACGNPHDSQVDAFKIFGPLQQFPGTPATLHQPATPPTLQLPEHIPEYDADLQTIPLPVHVRFFIERDAEEDTEAFRIVHVAANARRTFAVSSRGAVYVWGGGGMGELGLGRDVEQVREPMRIPLKEKVVKAAAGLSHSFLLVERE
ncbi:hypothetical protein JCM6882_001119 [Rhodosporidiobolus microsporus]